jgi:protein phosphatase
MLYLVHDDRPDRETRRCWTCGHDATPRGARTCHACGAPMSTRRFLVSSRWDGAALDAWQTFASRRLTHPGVRAPVDLLRLDDQLLSVVPYAGEGLLIDEASPLSNQRVLYLAQRVLGVMAWLAQQGIRCGPIRREQLLVSPDGTVRVFDFDIEALYTDPVPQEDLAPVLRGTADMLRAYCHVRSTPLADFLGAAALGDFTTVRELGRAVEGRFDAMSALAFPPTIGAMSDVGLARQLNEDAWGWTLVDKKTELYVVADGMGGHEGGEVASNLAVAAVLRSVRDRLGRGPVGLDGLETTLGEAFRAANQAIRAEAEVRGNDMGTTLVGMIVQGGRQAFVANVGDSRAYLFRERALHPITVDHSFVQRLVERGRLTKEEARTHPQSNVLLRTVGTDRELEVDLFRVELQAGDRVLLCSDGLWGEVEDADMANILSTWTDPRVAARELVRAAHQGGGKDNVTLMVVAIR